MCNAAPRTFGCIVNMSSVFVVAKRLSRSRTGKGIAREDSRLTEVNVVSCERRSLRAYMKSIVIGEIDKLTLWRRNCPGKMLQRLQDLYQTVRRVERHFPSVHS